LNYLALVLFKILGGPKFTLQGPASPQRPPSGKILTRAQVFAFIYIIVNFQLCSSINERPRKRSVYNRFCIETSAKMGFLGVEAKIFGGNHPRNAMTADLRSLVKKLWRCSKYPGLYARQRNYKKKHKNGMSTP